MDKKHIEKTAGEMKLQLWQVENVLKLLDEGGTIPFISRYRKELSGSLDEVAIADIRDRITQLREIAKRREYILKTIDEQGNLTTELRNKINAAETLTELEDLYLPYKPKRRTKATIAREKGLEPLAKKVFEQSNFNINEFAGSFIDKEKEVSSVDEALHGARDIMAEWISEDAEVREKLRNIFWKEGWLVSKVMKGKELDGNKYHDYFDYREKLSKIPSHRMLALRRGEKELFLSVDIQPDEASAIFLIEKKIITQSGPVVEQVKIAINDSYKRLLKPTLETEVRLQSKKGADLEAIHVFADNLKQLLLASPLGQKRIMAVDPGFRTGCKVVCLDKQGKLLENTAIYPNEPQKDVFNSSKTVLALIERNKVEAIAVGNGTAGRETEAFLKSIGIPDTISILSVNESGASIYSASDVARKEFPDYDITVRGAVSIGRRLLDPLAELVKIDAKSIGVGQYQHDVDQSALKKSLDEVVSSCVNGVGVELNTASSELLSYVSGLGPQLADNIIKYRDENGPFKSRAAIKKVARMGGKAFEQCAGFLRIRNSENPLDKSAVHPERYSLVKEIAGDYKSTVKDLLEKEEIRSSIDISKYVTPEIGLPTLKDIMQELEKPGRDPREQFEMFQFDEDVKEIEDLKIGMELPGIVTNVTKFGAFVDVGVHQDGLVHISQLSDQYVSDPAQVVKINQKVKVRVMEVDIQRKRIALSMKTGANEKAPRTERKQQKPKPESGEGDLQAKLNALKGKFN